MADDLIAKLKTPDECAVFERNVTERGRPDLALAARKRALELRALRHGASNEVERECLEAVFAYEQVLSVKNGKTTRASRTWPMIDRHGVIQAVERSVNRKDATAGYAALVEMGLEAYAFEAVVLRHPSSFTDETVQRSRERMSDRGST
jgi:plasmid stability protein